MGISFDLILCLEGSFRAAIPAQAPERELVALKARQT
jgi:hypothetical protein